MITGQDKTQKQILDDLSQTIKLYKQKSRMILKIALTTTPQQKQQKINSLNQYLYNLKAIVAKYEEDLSFVIENWIVVQRYISRIRQISNTFMEKTAKLPIRFYFIQQLNRMTNFNKEKTMSQLLQTVLMSLPKQYNKLEKEVSPTLIMPVVSRVRTQCKKQNHHFNRHSYNVSGKPLKQNNIQRTIDVYDCLDLDEGEYRRKYIRIKDEEKRNNKINPQDMIQRNKFIFSKALSYRREYEEFISRSLEKMQKRKFKISYKRQNSEDKKVKFLQFTEDKTVFAEKLLPQNEKNSIKIKKAKTNLGRTNENDQSNLKKSCSPSPVYKSISSAKIVKKPYRQLNNGKSLARYLDKVQTNQVFHMTRVQLIQTQINEKKQDEKVVVPFYTKVKKRQLDMSRKCIEERKRLNNQSNYNKAKAKFIIKSMESLFLRGTGNVIN